MHDGIARHTGSTKTLFSFYPDEVSFRASEFIGLTEEEAHSQHGSWSIKAVLPALCPDLSYDTLDGVQDGNMAQAAYQEAIAQDATGECKAQLKDQLHEYFKLDTLAMVRIWQAFKGASS